MKISNVTLLSHYNGILYLYKFILYDKKIKTLLFPLFMGFF